MQLAAFKAPAAAPAGIVTSSCGLLDHRESATITANNGKA